MTFVPNCEHDLFVSYAHIDNQRGWVDSLHSLLQTRIVEILGEAIEIWRDRKLDGLDLFNDVIKAALHKTAVLVSVVSPRYVRSENCLKEVRWFVEASPVPAIANKSRIARVRKTPLTLDMVEPVELHPEETLGFPFFKNEDAIGSIEFGTAPGDNTYPDFSAQVNLLAKAIARVLHKMREDAKEQDPGRTVFLAEPATKLKSSAIKLRAEFQTRGYRVVPETSLLQGPTLDRERLESALAEANIAIHLIGSTYAVVPEGERASIEEIQFEEAARHRLPQMVWLQVADATDERQQAFIARIRGTESPDQRLELCEKGFSELLESALDVLRERQAAAAAPREAAKSIYIALHKDDVESAELRAIVKHLANAGYPVEISLFEASDGKLRILEEKQIMSNDATVIFYGLGKDVWLRQKRQFVKNALLKIAGRRRRERAIYLCVPKTPIKDASYGVFCGRALEDTAGLPPLLVLGDFQPFSEEKIAPLLGRLNRSARPPPPPEEPPPRPRPTEEDPLSSAPHL